MLRDILRSDTLTGQVARRLIPVALVLMPALGLVRVIGEEQGLYDGRVGVGIMVVVGTLVLLAVSWWALSLIRRSAHERLAAEQQLDRFFALSPDLFVVAGFDGRFHRLNRSWEATLGYSPEELASRPFLDFVHPDDREATTAAFTRLLDGEDVIAFENRYIHRDGSARWLQWNARANPRDRLIQAVARDVTETREAHRELARTGAEVRDLYEHAPVGYHSVDGDGVIVRMNDTELSWLGYERDELIGRMRFRDLMTPDSRARAVPIFEAFKEAGEIRDQEVDLVRKDGSILPVAVSATAVRDAEGRFVASRTTLVDITARRAIEAERERAREEAERANRAKSEFLSRMSHELRTPMNAVLGFAQLLERDPDLTPDQLDSVHYIASGGRHLLALIDEVLDISRIEAGRLPLSPEAVAVADLVDDAMALVRPLAAERGVRLSGDPEACACHVRADRQRLKQVVLNLLSNAVKYNREGGTVEVTCAETDAGRLRIAVSDTGPGIAAEHLERLFVPFERLDAEGSDAPGTGIGLALSKGLVEAMGGSIGVESRTGEGSTFWVDLDRLDDPVAQLPARAAVEAAPAPPTAGSVLYIEDNLANVRLIERVLADRPGVELLTAMQGRLGIELARKHRPDLVLLDLHLPDLAGQDVLRELRGSPLTESIPVAIISADATNGQVTRLLEAGANAYLSKPLDVARLLEVVDRAVGAARG